MLNLTFCDTVLPVSVKTRPTVAAVAGDIIPAVCKNRAPVPIVGACLRIVSKDCEQNKTNDNRLRSQYMTWYECSRTMYFENFVIYHPH